MYQRLKQICLFKSKLVKMNFYQVQNTLCPLERDAAINMHIYSLTPYSNKACHLFIFSLYAVRRTHIDFSTVNFIYGIFVSMKSFKMIISILYCLKFFTFTCTLFCPLWRGEKNKKNERTGLQMHAPGHFAVTLSFRYDVDVVPSHSGRQVQTGEEHSCPC